MNEDLTLAREALESGNYTCVLQKGACIYTATARGVKPLVNWLDSGVDCSGFCAADKVVGKATAFLYCLLGVKAVYAAVMSTPAKGVLQAQGITALCGREVEGIINRRGDGPCPFEAAVWNMTEPREALSAIRAKQREMGIA